jgi:hypothetical protein
LVNFEMAGSAMANWIKFIRTDGQSPDARSLVTLRPGALAFNSHFIRTNKLQEQTRVSVYCDPSRYRIGLQFHVDGSDQNSFAVTADGGKTGGVNRAVQISSVMKQHRWLAAAARNLKPSGRRYQPVWFAPDGLWIINVRPSFEIRVASADLIEAGLLGIYRYRTGEQIVYIGRGDIRGRAGSAERANWGIDSIEYSVIEDAADREKWEASWLDEHRNEFGTLPLYNRIGGTRGSEE